MRSTILDLHALRRRILPKPQRRAPTLAELTDESSKVSVSRREMLGIAGVAAVTLPPASRAIAASTREPLGIDTTPGRAVFRLGEEVRWTVDVARFAGAPKLRTEELAQGMLVELTGAKYPGTEIPADFTATITKDAFGATMDLKLGLDGFHSKVSLERWLAGDEPARSAVEARGPMCVLGNGSALEATGAAEAEFTPDWRLRLAGTRVAMLAAAGTAMSADGVTVSLMAPEADSLLADKPELRTLVALERGDEDWSPVEALATGDASRIVPEGSAFDSIEIEASETARALVASGRGTRLSFRPGGTLVDDAGEPISIPLSNARYAVAADESVLIADFASKPVLLHADGLSLELGHSSAARFEVAGTNGSRAVTCAPALLSVTAPLADAVVDSMLAPEGTTIELVTNEERIAQRRQIPRVPIVVPKDDDDEEADDTKPTLRPGVRIQPRGDVELTPGRGNIRLRPGGNEVLIRPGITIARLDLSVIVLPVLRTADFLSLGFQFINLQLSTEAPKVPKLQRIDEDKPAYVVVHFPPQHISEQAFWEMENSLEPLTLPSITRMSGPSRLSFELPKDKNSLPYTLESLLDWSTMKLSVAPTALALPAPKRAMRVRPTGGRKPTVIPKLSPAAGGGRLTIGTTAPPRLAPDARRKPPAAVVAAGRAMATLPAANLLRLLKPVAPERHETAIEAPYRLIISPHASSGWVHATEEVTHNDRTELWHTRLGVRGAGGKTWEYQYAYGKEENVWRVLQVVPPNQARNRDRTIRAIWSPDYKATFADAVDNDPNLLMSLNGLDRNEFVWLMSDFRIPECTDRAAHASKLMLTSLGAWMDVRYGPELPSKYNKDLSREEWVHRATQGRDQYVKVVEKGYLFPFGHRVSLVKVTERKFETTGGGNSVAVLRQRQFIVVREPEKMYPAVGQVKDGRRMPFRRVVLTTLISPNLDPQIQVAGVGKKASDCFWPIVEQKDFAFSMIGEDWDGEQSEFTTPVIFVTAAGGLAYEAASMTKVRTAYLGEGGSRRKRELFGQNVAYADTTRAKPGDTTLETESVTWGAEVDETNAHTDLDLSAISQPRFYPTVEEAAVRIPAVVQIAGQNTATRVRIGDTYVDDAWDAAANMGSVYAELLDAPGLGFPNDKSGGLMSPDFSITVLSVKFGPVGGGVGDIATGIFNPEEFFKNAGAKLLGAVDLWDIIAGVFGDNEVPGLTIAYEKDQWQVPTRVTATYSWKPELTAFAGFTPECEGANAKFELWAQLDTDLTDTVIEPAFDSYAHLQNFTLDIIALVIKFRKLKFTAKTGQKPDVEVDIKKVEFAGPLEFVNALQDALSELVPGLSIDVTPTGVYIGYTLAIPTIAVGVMSIKNISLSIGLTLPFTGDPLRFRFAFCERNNPFILTVSIFGGGGFFAIELLPDGLDKLEASFEFGANFELDIGVASGGAHLMAGIYLKIEDGNTSLSGYVRCGGHLSILGIITISCEFYLSLNYESATNRCYGQAKLTVEIEILFFSKSVSMTVEREFAGSGGGNARLDDQRFAALMDEIGRASCRERV